MARKKFGLSFDGIEDMAKKLDQMGGRRLEQAAENSLKATHDYITPKLHNAMAKHKRTGRTDASIIDNANVEWSGSKASIDIGFNISNQGLASVFLMYGTPRRRKGHDRGYMTADKELYNAIYGAATKRRIAEIQKEEFEKLLSS